jgi:hypothetical protein
MTTTFLLDNRKLTKGKRAITLFVLPALLPVTLFAQQSQLPQQPQAMPVIMQGPSARGEDLFTGRTSFHNGGPACIACHSITGLSFPNGGTLGPDLTHTYEKLGPTGTKAAMQTLYFPTMIPVYRDHQLTPLEQADMVAYFKQTASETRPPAQWITQFLIFAAFVLGIIFVAITAFSWRKRVLSVRRDLVARATGQGVRS